MASFSYLWILVIKKIAIKLQFIGSERFDIEEGPRWVPLGGRNSVESMSGLGVANGGYRRICLGRRKMGLRGIYYMRK